MGKTLIVYHSVSGNTEKIALGLSRLLEADLVKINDKEKSGSLLIKTPSILLQWSGILRKDQKINIDAYERIFIGSPCWGYRVTPQVKHFVENHDFRGKEVLLFMTHGGDCGNSSDRFKALIKDGIYLGMLDYQISVEDKVVMKDLKRLGVK
ncbi:hypothetical protein EZV73_19945 [Acidaminobacter sp. JC074]|uniref:flavodoxin n=1 Tax=Acidaminobacter sp. JC074 TaxID=2530199 RepID=UPI001F0DBF9D|nr:flavodoxin [Acidaminobacter sp. JC074]MCH4889865.1 hypothetical protein [Acidaminobacter sp. JC074]